MTVWKLVYATKENPPRNVAVQTSENITLNG